MFIIIIIIIIASTVDFNTLFPRISWKREVRESHGLNSRLNLRKMHIQVQAFVTSRSFTFSSNFQFHFPKFIWINNTVDTI
jgi:hypothetical protein